ncbi:MAG: TIGR04100 family radical SAM protein [Clostridia bacterium]|nr:TIGR04100 family radical SAM protein [Clostridia bacterium]
MTILYEVYDNLYVNLTNKCPCNCTFCLRQTRDSMDEEKHSLWLLREPSVDEVKAEFDQFDMSYYKEIVFCGYGEPTERMDVLAEVARYIKRRWNKPIRVNTNGLGNLIWGKDITPQFEGIVDTVSISLNTPNADKYHALVRSRFGNESFKALLEFAGNVKKYVPNVVMTTVATTLTKEEEEQCQRICDELDVTYRIRPWED